MRVCEIGIASYGYGYNEKNQLVREDISISTGDDSLNRCLERTYDQFGRPIGYQLKNGDQVEQSLSYTYNTAGQVARITADGKQFDYQYVEKEPSLISGMSSPVHTVSNTYDEKQSTLSNKTNSWKNKIDSPIISSYSYTVNSFGQRTSVYTEGEAFSNAPAPWVWNYDVLGQVIKANNYDYSYDSIGNRRTSGKNNEVLENYTSNNLNQYTSVNTLAPSYDNEGNLLSGLTPTSALPDRSNLNFTYNAENRPIMVKNGNEIIEEYAYDHGGRRVKKGNTIIIYDGYNAIAEYDLSSKSLKETYAWGLDLSNSTQGAGGVGGLLSVTDYTTQTPLISYPTYDGNGNVSEYITEVDNGSISAHYEYDSFGNVIKKTGNSEYTYQFSTKPYDTLTGLNYYNYRLYDPTNGRWINRDPIQEKGGLNLYNFVGNNGVNSWDYLGKQNFAYVVTVSIVCVTERKEDGCPICKLEGRKGKGTAEAADADTARADATNLASKVCMTPASAVGREPDSRNCTYSIEDISYTRKNIEPQNQNIEPQNQNMLQDQIVNVGNQ